MRGRVNTGSVGLQRLFAIPVVRKQQPQPWGGRQAWRAASEDGDLLPPRIHPGFAAGAVNRQAASTSFNLFGSKHNLTPKRPHGVSGPYLCDSEDMETMHQRHYVPDPQPLYPPSLQLSQQDLLEDRAGGGGQDGESRESRGYLAKLESLQRHRPP